SDVEAQARRFSEQLLTAITDRLDARANGRLVLVRRLPIRIRTRRELFADRAEIERIADDFAAAIPLEQAASTRTEHDDVVVFDDEVDWRAAYLVEVAQARDTSAWWFAALVAEPDGIAGLATQPRADIERVLVRVARMNVLESLLARLPAVAVERLAA